MEKITKFPYYGVAFIISLIIIILIGIYFFNHSNQIIKERCLSTIAQNICGIHYYQYVGIGNNNQVDGSLLFFTCDPTHLPNGRVNNELIGTDLVSYYFGNEEITECSKQ